MSKLEVDSDSDYLSDEMNDIRLKRKPFNEIIKKIKNDNYEDDIFGWNGGNDQTIFAQRVIKRFRLKRLKSFNKEAYYFDNVSYHIWQYSKDINSGVENLLKPSDDVCKKLREINEIRYESYMWQPDEFW